ncbi:uncharacterized protein PODANS_3_9260 [Podospora anserina S mat+]|uniref:Podospora anserina S mat+ genomic DNA chromosome 3, supercontig 2 n=1 Tax=Podospora anserina (strain S / ATCC MYA-4624 / DSM 980 / FGSC 10383) TaxID=515849 RepID=B2B145_PODAN|nr:uncharacterized protein PODANS_3_9260 [Podospora anserina S mat+]CAP70868.1 unnamed protein product [Podospora anserina S mat+]
MRFSTATAALAALGPLSAAAAESPFEQYKAKFQNFLSSFSGSAGIPEAADNVQVPIPKPKSKTVEPKKIDTLTLANWKDTLYAPVHAEATTPEELLVLITGGNNTCFSDNAAPFPLSRPSNSQSTDPYEISRPLRQTRHGLFPIGTQTRLYSNQPPIILHFASVKLRTTSRVIRVMAYFVWLWHCSRA